jgi:hypothetical protein
MPEATPALVIVALPMLVLHTPPGVELVYIVNDPWHIVLAPRIVPPVGVAFTVTT